MTDSEIAALREKVAAILGKHGLTSGDYAVYDRSYRQQAADAVLAALAPYVAAQVAERDAAWRKEATHWSAKHKEVAEQLVSAHHVTDYWRNRWHAAAKQRDAALARVDATQGAFWDDLARDLKDPEFRRAYIIESDRIATADAARRDALASVLAAEAYARRVYGGASLTGALDVLRQVRAAVESPHQKEAK